MFLFWKNFSGKIVKSHSRSSLFVRHNQPYWHVFYLITVRLTPHVTYMYYSVHLHWLWLQSCVARLLTLAYPNESSRVTWRRFVPWSTWCTCQISCWNFLCEVARCTPVAIIRYYNLLLTCSTANWFCVGLHLYPGMIHLKSELNDGLDLVLF
jgi:hypothetical protein